MPKAIHKRRAKDPREHAKQRAKERYGLDFSDNDLQRISALIRDGCAMAVWKESHSRSHFIVRYKGEYLYTVYGNLIKTVHTFLPSHCISDRLLEKIDKFPHW